MSRLQCRFLSMTAVIDGIILMIGYAMSSQEIPPPPASGLAVGLMIALLFGGLAYHAQLKLENVWIGRKWMALWFAVIHTVFVMGTIDTSIGFTYLFASLAAVGLQFGLYAGWKARSTTAREPRRE